MFNSLYNNYYYKKKGSCHLISLTLNAHRVIICVIRWPNTNTSMRQRKVIQLTRSLRWSQYSQQTIPYMRWIRRESKHTQRSKVDNHGMQIVANQ